MRRITWVGRSAALSACLTCVLAAADAQTDDRAAYPYLLQAVEATGRCDWKAILGLAESARAVAPRGSAAWLGASALLVRARYEHWEPQALEDAARALLAEVVKIRRANPEARVSALGPLHPVTAGHVIGAQINLARVLQSRGLHHEALGHLLLVLGDLRSGPVGNAAYWAELASLDAAWSFEALGRGAEAFEMLCSLRDGRSGSRKAAHASVLLQNGGLGLSAYRGKYEGDPALARRLRALLEKLPGARARLADRLGLELEELPHIPVGVADTPREVEGAFAVTEGDPRRLAFPPAVIFFTEALTFELFDLEQLLVHELSHAVLMQRLGMRYEAMPPWLAEAVSQALAGELEQRADRVTSLWLGTDPQRFCAEDFWSHRKLEFRAEPCSDLPTVEGSLVGFFLERQAGHAGLLRFLSEVESGSGPDEALRTVYGVGLEELPDAARKTVRAEIEVRRQELLAPVRALLEVRPEGTAAVLARAEELLRIELPPIARAFALRSRAESLEALGDLVRAATAWDELYGARALDPCTIELSLIGRARCTLAAGRLEEARGLFEELGRDAPSRRTRKWAAAQRQTIPGGDG